jgi:hypothetical protein
MDWRVSESAGQRDGKAGWDLRPPILFAKAAKRMGHGEFVEREAKKAGAGPAFCAVWVWAEADVYVVERGLTAMAVAGTMVPVPV